MSRSTFAGIAAACAALSLGVLIDASAAFALFSGRVPYDAGSNRLYDLYQQLPVKVSTIGIVISTCLLVIGFATKASSPSRLTACRVLSVLTVGLSVAGLTAIRRVDPHSSFTAQQLHQLVLTSIITSGSAIVSSILLYSIDLR